VFTQRIAAIAPKLAAARAAPGSEKWFGAEKHGFALRAPLAESEVAGFERQHGVTLPSDYRQFLLLAGDGGAGPYYGIDPLSAWSAWYEEEGEEPGFLAAPCPLVDGAACRQAWAAAQGRDARRAQGIVKAGAGPCEAWREFLPCDWLGWGRGTINLSDQGCTYSARLIVSGEARGRVVYLDEQGWYPPYFVKDPTFLDWYERWLEEAAAGREPVQFGFDNPGYGRA
jgi:hypothetical protein